MSDINITEQNTNTEGLSEVPAYMNPGHNDMGSELPDYMKIPGNLEAPDTMDLINQFMGDGEKQDAPQQTEVKKPEAQQQSEQKNTPEEQAQEGEVKEEGLFDRLLNKDKQEEPESLVDTIKEPENMSEQSLEGWKDLKSKAKEFERENTELKQKLSSYEGNPEQINKYQEQIDALNQEKEKLLNQIAEKDLTAHPEFQQKYQEPLDNSLKRIEAVLEDTNSDIKISDLLKMKKRDLADAVEEITDGMPKVYARDFVEEIAKARELSEAREDALGNASQFMSNISEQSKTQAFEDFNKTASEFKNEHGYLFNPLRASESATEAQKHEVEVYNKALADIETKAQSFAFGQMNNSQLTKVAMQAAANEFMVTQAIPRLEKEYMSLLNANQQMAQQLRELQGIKPKVNSPTGNAPEKATSDMSRQELIDFYMKR